jgi:hypothetical protein
MSLSMYAYRKNGSFLASLQQQQQQQQHNYLAT